MIQSDSRVIIENKSKEEKKQTNLQGDYSFEKEFD